MNHYSFEQCVSSNYYLRNPFNQSTNLVDSNNPKNFINCHNLNAMTSMYHPHPHHNPLGFMPKSTSSTLLDNNSMQSTHNNLFNQVSSSNNSNCQNNASAIQTMSTSISQTLPSHLQATQSVHHQMQNSNNSLNCNSDINTSNNCNGTAAAAAAAAAAVAGYYNLSHPQHFNPSSSLQPHYSSLFNPMIGNPTSTTSNSSFVQYHQNQMTNGSIINSITGPTTNTANSPNYLSNTNSHLPNSSSTLPINNNFHSNRFNNVSSSFHTHNNTSNSLPVAATSMLMNGRLMFNELNGSSAGSAGSNSACSNSTLNSLEEGISKKPTG